MRTFIPRRALVAVLLLGATLIASLAPPQVGEAHVVVGGSDVVAGDSDEDGDGFSDALETALGSNPLSPTLSVTCIVNPSGTDGGLDSDNDHLLDSCEVGALTTVGNPDTDGDGVKDGMEVAVGTDPTGGSGYPSGIDTDGDGCLNEVEKGGNELLGGKRHPGNYWDLYDVNGTGSVGLSDPLRILAHFGHGATGSDGSPVTDHEVLDRANSGGSNAYPPGFLGESDTGVDFRDALASLVQFATGGCGAPGPVPVDPATGIYP